MKSYKFVSYDREYKSWDIYDSVTLIEEEYSPDSTWKGFDPIKNKIFSGDVYEYDGEKVKILNLKNLIFGKILQKLKKCCKEQTGQELYHKFL